MIVRPVKTEKIYASSKTIFEVLDNHLPALQENTVVAITSKVVSLCQGRIVPMAHTSIGELIQQEADLYTKSSNKYGQVFTITNGALIAKSGIDKNSKRGYYILWPKNPQQTANKIRRHLKQRHAIKNLGVILTDSISTPARYGVTGIAIAHSGFQALNPYSHSQANISGGLAAAAVVAMGEGVEHTPIAIITDVPFVRFQINNPTKKELDALRLSPEDDFYNVFLSKVTWQKGRGS